jgi:hypothetical protein
MISIMNSKANITKQNVFAIYLVSEVSRASTFARYALVSSSPVGQSQRELKQLFNLDRGESVSWM